VGESSSQGKDSFRTNDEVLLDNAKNKTDDGMRSEDLSDEKVEFDPNEDDLLSSQELEEFAKDMEEMQTDFQTKVGEVLSFPSAMDKNQDPVAKKTSEVQISITEGPRKSSRLEKNDDVRVADKAISRAEAKDAFLNKGMSNNPFSLLNASNEDLCDISNKLGVCLGSSEANVIANLDLIRELEMSRKTLAIQSCGNKNYEEPIVDDDNNVDSSVHADSEKELEYDLLDVMVLRKGRKIKHRKNNKKKTSPKIRYTPNKKREVEKIYLPPDPF
jgi:hypothetical protein